MLNNVILVGRLTADPEITEGENGIKRSTIVLAVPRTHKAPDGTYETDFIKCTLWNSVAEHTCEYCKKGDTVGVKGRIQNSSYTKDNETKYVTDIIVEKISFLTTCSNKDKEETEE